MWMIFECNKHMFQDANPQLQDDENMYNQTAKRTTKWSANVKTRSSLLMNQLTKWNRN